MKALILDTETTDLISNSVISDQFQPRVIEFYGQIVSDDGFVHDSLEFLCTPGFELQKITTDITGLTTDDVKDKPPFKHFAWSLKKLIESADAVVGHNLAYDYSMIEMEMDRCNIIVDWPWVRICTVQETAWINGYRMNQSALHEMLFGEPFAGAHRAKADVEALTRIWVELRKRKIV